MEASDITFTKVLEAYKKKGYKFYTRGNFNVNLFGIRMDNVLDNKFSDFLGIAYYVNDRATLIVIPATTCPGLYGGHAAMNPRPGGVAIIKPGQYIGSHQFIDSYTGWLKYPYFQQVGKLTIWRDGDKDTEIDPTNEQFSEGDGINIHMMSNDEVIESKNAIVNNWSEGCNGAVKKEFKKLFAAVRECVTRYGFNFTYTLFEKADFQ